MLATDTTRRGWRLGFAGILLAAMAVSTYFAAVVGVLAPFLRDDLGLSRTQIGALISVMIVVAAAASPSMGTAADMLGGRTSLFLVFATAAASFVLLPLAPWYWLMFVAPVVAALSQAAVNPATNKLIALHAPPGRRGVVTGIKQSGVQAGVVLVGMTAPAAAVALGWRWTTMGFALLPLVGVVATALVIPADRPATRPRWREKRPALPPSITFLAVYGALMGFGAAYVFLIPLFVDEALGLGERVGGAAAGLIGLIALFGRIGWARFAEKGERYGLSLAAMAALSVLAAGSLLAAEGWGPWALWVGVLLTGASSASWNSVGMLAVIHEAGEARAGRASGVVMLGFLAGLGVAPTLFGWTVDVTGSYVPMWLVSIGVLGLAAAVAGWRMRPRRR